jgi:preprotein translocase subunit SecA
MKKVFGTKQDRDIKAMRPLLVQINALWKPQMKAMSDEELKGANS